jgi:hypothetical protein
MNIAGRLIDKIMAPISTHWIEIARTGIRPIASLRTHHKINNNATMKRFGLAPSALGKYTQRDYEVFGGPLWAVCASWTDHCKGLVRPQLRPSF